MISMSNFYSTRLVIVYNSSKQLPLVVIKQVLRECRELCNRIVAGRTKQNAQGPATDDTLNDLTLMLRCHYEAALR